jgi:hypothetical protein
LFSFTQAQLTNEEYSFASTLQVVKQIGKRINKVYPFWKHFTNVKSHEMERVFFDNYSISWDEKFLITFAIFEVSHLLHISEKVQLYQLLPDRFITHRVKKSLSSLSLLLG